jgi:hypothetical protein
MVYNKKQQHCFNDESSNVEAVNSMHRDRKTVKPRKCKEPRNAQGSKPNSKYDFQKINSNGLFELVESKETSHILQTFYFYVSVGLKMQHEGELYLYPTLNVVLHHTVFKYELICDRIKEYTPIGDTNFHRISGKQQKTPGSTEQMILCLYSPEVVCETIIT